MVESCYWKAFSELYQSDIMELLPFATNVFKALLSLGIDSSMFVCLLRLAAQECLLYSYLYISST